MLPSLHALCCSVTGPVPAVLCVRVLCCLPSFAAKCCCREEAGWLCKPFKFELACGLRPACRDCAVEVGATVLLTWLARVVQLQPLGLVVQDRAVRIITGGQEGVGTGWGWE